MTDPTHPPSERPDDWPDRIYLIREEADTSYGDGFEITWCDAKQFDHDIEYIRADRASHPPSVAVPLIERLRSVPKDARMRVDDYRNSIIRSLPVGALCHEAADALAAPHPATPDLAAHREAIWKEAIEAAAVAAGGAGISDDLHRMMERVVRNIRALKGRE